MGFLIDIGLIVLLIVVIRKSVKRGFTNHTFFDLVKTLLAIGIAGGAVAGLYLALVETGFIQPLTDNVVEFLGNVKVNLGFWNQETLELVASYLAFAPFGIFTLVVVYIVSMKLLGLIGKLFKLFRDKCKVWRAIDNCLGFVLNLGLTMAIILACFGVVHTLNVERELPPDTAYLFEGTNEFIKSSTIGNFIYEINPLNDILTEQIDLGGMLYESILYK